LLNIVKCIEVNDVRQKILKKLEEKIHQNEFRKENISVWSIFCQGLVAKRCKASLDKKYSILHHCKAELCSRK